MADTRWLAPARSCCWASFPCPASAPVVSGVWATEFRSELVVSIPAPTDLATPVCAGRTHRWPRSRSGLRCSGCVWPSGRPSRSTRQRRVVRRSSLRWKPLGGGAWTQGSTGAECTTGAPW